MPTSHNRPSTTDRLRSQLLCLGIHKLRENLELHTVNRRNQDPTAGDKHQELLDCLQDLEQLDSRQAALVELHLVAQLPLTEIAAIFDVRLSNIERDWRLARAWLRTRLRK